MFRAIHSGQTPGWLRALCLGTVFAFAYSTNAAIINAAVNLLSSKTQDLIHHYPGQYTQRPIKLKAKESILGRDPIHRGGWWTDRQLQDRQSIDAELAATKTDQLLINRNPVASSALAPPGGPIGIIPGESGSTSGGGYSSRVVDIEGVTLGKDFNATRSQLNSNTGNKMTVIPLFAWNSHGMNIGLTLYHNSLAGMSHSPDLPQGWSHNWDTSVRWKDAGSVGGTAIVRLGNGTEIPYTLNQSLTWVGPAGTGQKLTGGPGNFYLTSPSQYTAHLVTQGSVNSGSGISYLQSISDRDGKTATVTRNQSSQMTKVTGPDGRSFIFGQLVTDPMLRHWIIPAASQTTSPLSQIGFPSLTSTSGLDGPTRDFTYDPSSIAILTDTSVSGKTTTYTYNVNGRLASTTDNAGKIWRIDYTATDAIFTDPSGQVSSQTYSSGLLSAQRDEAGFTSQYTYDANRNLTSILDKNGNVWTGIGDANGNTLSETDPLGHTVSYAYSALNDVLSVTDALGRVVGIDRDSRGHAIRIKNANAQVVQRLGYDAYGQVTLSSDALNRTTTIGRDTYGNVLQVTAPDSTVTTSTYDILGRVTSTTDAAGATYSLVYDNWSRPVSVIAPNSATSSIAYNIDSQVVSATDPLGRSGSRMYDSLGRLLSATNAKAETTSYTYDTVDRVASITNGRGYARTYGYTPRGETASLTLADGSLEQWSYDGNGNTTAYTNPLGQVINYAFDAAERQTAVNYPTGPSTTFSYDNADRTLSMVDGSGTSSWTYDNLDQVTQLTTPQGVMSYTYDISGAKTSMTDVGTGTTSYLYDGYGRLASMTNPFTETTSFNYDGAGRLSRKNLANGTYESYSYDSLSRVSNISTKNSSGAVLQSRGYTFDLASQVTQVVEGAVTTNFGYDNAGQLTSEAKSTGYSAGYTYDGNGNRLSRTVNGIAENYSYDNGDKLLAVSGGNDPRTFAYDAAGRTTGISRSSGTTAFTYDYESRVTQVTKPGMVTNSNSYNGLDTRVAKTDSGGTKTFKRAGVGVTAAVLSDGAASYTPGISEKRGGASTFYSGGIKNTDTQTDATQAVSASRLYDAFGNVIAGTGNWKSPFGNAGKFGYQEDPDTGLKLLGHRYYDSSTGRFLTRDPAKDGRNWFGYCHNAPVGQIDADGLKRKLVIILGDTENLPLTRIITWLKDQYEADYDIVIVNGNNPQVVEDALVDADAAIMIGHGAPFVCRKKGIITPSTLARVASRRKALGKGKLDFLRIYSCNALTDEEDLKAYLSIAHHVFGYKTLCWFSSGDADTNDGGKWYNDGEADQTGFDVETPWSPRRTATWGGGSRRDPVAVGF